MDLKKHECMDQTEETHTGYDLDCTLRPSAPAGDRQRASFLPFCGAQPRLETYPQLLLNPYPGGATRRLHIAHLCSED